MKLVIGIIAVILCIIVYISFFHTYDKFRGGGGRGGGGGRVVSPVWGSVGYPSGWGGWGRIGGYPYYDDQYDCTNCNEYGQCICRRKDQRPSSLNNDTHYN
jgi:hypothetical protein